MITLRIQHSVPNFDSWRRAFEADPVDRKGGGVRRYRIHRSLSEPNLVMIDLEFDAAVDAQAFLTRLRALWGGAAQSIMKDPQAWIVETIESVEV